MQFYFSAIAWTTKQVVRMVKIFGEYWFSFDDSFIQLDLGSYMVSRWNSERNEYYIRIWTAVFLLLLCSDLDSWPPEIIIFFYRATVHFRISETVVHCVLPYLVVSLPPCLRDFVSGTSGAYWDPSLNHSFFSCWRSCPVVFSEDVLFAFFS